MLVELPSSIDALDGYEDNPRLYGVLAATFRGRPADAAASLLCLWNGWTAAGSRSAASP